MIDRGRLPEAFVRAPQNVDVRQSGLDHYNVGAFVDIERDFSQRFLGVRRIHLIRTSIAKLGRALGCLAKRPVKN